jgi:hypothetical protein
MSTINLNDTTPAPPLTYTNLKWQASGDGSISAYDPALVGLGAGWVNWTPTLFPSGSMTATAPTSVTAQYCRLGPILFFQLAFTTTLGGTLSNILYVASLPLAEANVNIFYPCAGLLGNYATVNAFVQNNQLVFIPPGGANFTAGVTTFYASGAYRCA